MSKELNRMQELAGVPVKKDSLNEHQIGGIVGVGAINQIPPREKSDYEMAFEHFMTEGEERELEEMEMTTPDNPKMVDKDGKIITHHDELETEPSTPEKHISTLKKLGYNVDMDWYKSLKENYYEEDDTMEEAVSIPAEASAIRDAVRKMIKDHDNDADLGAAVREKFAK